MALKLSNLFNIEYESDDYSLIRRINLINFFFIVEILIFSIFTFVNFFKLHKYGIAIFDMVAAIVFIAAFLDLRLNGSFNRSKWITTLTLASFMILFAQVNQNDSFGLIWTIIVPVVIISLHGHKEGLKLSFLYALVLLSFAFAGVGDWQHGEWNYVSFTRLLFALAILVFISYVGERSIDRFQKSLHELSITDYLTKLYNRRKIDEILLAEIKNAQRYQTPLSIIILDVDHFKEINDQYGHLIGDHILIQLSELLKAEIRETDFLGRWGGEEFIIINPHTSEKEAYAFAQRLRQQIEAHAFEIVRQMTCSFGVCEYSQASDTMFKLISCADSALYKAKELGRNRVFSFEQDDQ